MSIGRPAGRTLPVTGLPATAYVGTYWTAEDMQESDA